MIIFFQNKERGLEIQKSDIYKNEEMKQAKDAS